MERVKQIASHLTGTTGVVHSKSPDDVVITLAIRSPLCKARKGGFKDAHTDELLLEMFKHTIAHSRVPPAQVGEITVGTVLTPRPAWVARGAALAAGYPASVPVQVVNRFCSSGLMSVMDIANKIKAGMIDVGLAIGIESMSENPDDGAPSQSDDIKAHALAVDCAQPMGWTSENVAVDFSVSRHDQDAFAAQSFQRAERAQKAGTFKDEIVPFEVWQKDPKTGERKRVMVDRDDGIRYGTTAESLSKIRSAFPQWGHGATTGGNASQITDGVAAVMLMSRKKAEELGLEILGRYLQTHVAGVAPRIMGVGPVPAIEGVLKSVGLTTGEIDLFEINEAFASQCLYSIRVLGLDQEKVNVNGGAIAFGHPLGCTGARQIATGLHELKRRNGKILVTGMCIGTGMGAAAVFVRD